MSYQLSSTAGSVGLSGVPLGASTIKPPKVSAQDALDAYLAPWAPAGPHSFLEAAMRDSEAAINAGALWLGTLGYLVTVEQIGHCVRAIGAKARDGQGDRATFRGAALEFGDPTLDKRAVNTLYDVRCALAHEFSLYNDKRQFTYARGNLLIDVQPRATIVCVDAVWHYVRDLVDNVRALHANGKVGLAPKMTAERLIAMRFAIQP